MKSLYLKEQNVAPLLQARVYRFSSGLTGDGDRIYFENLSNTL